MPDAVRNPDVEADLAARVALITSSKPAALTKQYALDDDGELTKKNGGALVEGEVEILEIDNLTDFGELLAGLEPNQALTYGLPLVAPAKLMTFDNWNQAGRPPDAIPRTNDKFAFASGAGVMMLDYDPPRGGVALDRGAFVDAVRLAAPGLADAKMLWCPSSSSHIVNVETGVDLTGLRGQRIYILVTAAADIPRAGLALVERLWAAGHGHCEVSKSGSVLLRTLTDGSVWQGSRLDFAAGAACVEPLRQDRGSPKMAGGAIEIVDTATLIPDPTPDELAAAAAAKKAARLLVQDDAKQARASWVEDRVREMTGDDADEDAYGVAHATAVRAVEHGVLSSGFLIHLASTNGEVRTATVAEILDDPAKYDGLLTFDPLEPDYDGGRRVGKLYTSGARPRLYTLAHGGKSYSLIRQPVEIELVRGKTYDLCRKLLEHMRVDPDLFEFADTVVTVIRGRIVPFDEPSLADHLGGTMQFWRWHTPRQGEPVKVLEDPPPKAVKVLLSPATDRGLKRLEAVTTAPTLRPDGTILDTPGYDAETGLLFEPDGVFFPVPSEPDTAAAAAAVDRLMFPFSEFPFVGPADWAVLFSALLTAASRCGFPTAPAFGFDAPVQGSGKTLTALCAAGLASGEHPTIWPHTASRDDEEVRKRLFTALRTGTAAIVWDNVTGTFDSAAMAAAVTAPTFTDRVLGKSESATVPNRSIMLMTGNNLTIAGDMTRRVLISRMDPKSDRPYARQFDLDPLDYVLGHRQEMIVAALTVIRGWLTSGAERAPGRMASFEKWDDFVRQAVVWVGRDIYPGRFADPMDAIDTAQGADPAIETLGVFLRAWQTRFGDSFVSAREILAACQEVENDRSYANSAELDLHECLTEMGGGRAVQSTRGVGRILGFRRDRVVNGLKLQQTIDPHANAARWRVVAAEGDAPVCLQNARSAS